MAILRDEGLVLRTRDLGEADKVVTLLTRQAGKLQAAARGARRARSGLLPVVQPFAYGEYLVFQNKTLHNLSQGQLVRPFRRLREDLVAMAHATYVAELADAGLPEEEAQPEAFNCVLSAFTLLEKGVRRPELVIRWYELHLLHVLGYQPELTACVDCRSPIADNGDGLRLFFAVAAGGCLCPVCAGAHPEARPLSLAVYKSLLYLSAAAPEKLADLRFAPADAAAMDNLMTGYIEHRLERRLNSLEFLRSLQGMAP